MQNLVEMYPFTLSPDHFICLCFKTLQFWSFAIFSSFSLTWDHMGEKTSNDISSESASHIRSPNFMHTCTSKEGLYQKWHKYWWNFKYSDCVHTWDHVREKTSNDILSECTQQIWFQKFIHTPMRGFYQSCIKNCEISNFGFLPFSFCSFLEAFNIGVNGKLWNVRYLGNRWSLSI